MVIHLLSPDGIARPALHLQLRDLAGEGRAVPPRRRRRRQHLRRARLFDAHLARSREARGAQPDRGRRRRRAARPERAGRGRRPQPAAGAAARRLPAQRRDARAPHAIPRQFGNIIVKTDADGRVVRIHDIGQGRARRRGLQPQRLSRRDGGGALGHLPAPGLERACHRRPGRGDHEGAVQVVPARACNTTSSTTRPTSSPNPSRP